MNPITEAPPPPLQPLPPPPQPPQPHRSSSSCGKHPEEQFTGFCPSCLCERLTSLDQSSSAAAASSSRRPSTSSSSAAAALKSLFTKIPTTTATEPTTSIKSKPTNKPSFLAELRRTKSFSASKNEGLGFSGIFEPQRKSCDVRVRNTLWNLFTLDDESKYKPPHMHVQSSIRNTENFAAQNLGPVSSKVTGPVLESKEEDPDNSDTDTYTDNDDEIRVLEEPNNVSNVVEETVPEIVEEGMENDIKRMKDHIDLDSQVKKNSGMDLKEIAGSFWSAASVFSKKWQDWRRKQKLKKRNGGGDSVALPVEKPISRQYRETQSEIADYGFGRRSCDTDPRFSLDAGRISFDDPRYSFDEPRASWDGHFIGRTFPRLPPMVSVVEDAPVVHVSRTDTHIPVEEPINCINEGEGIPGGSIQTKEYYSDSSSRRRKSLDRSSSIRKTAAAVVAEIDEMKAVSNAKVSPATIDYINGGKVLVGDRDTGDPNSNSLRDDCSETFELAGFRDNASVIGNGERKGLKKSRRWSWNIWGFIHRRGGGNKDEDDERYSRGNGVERSFSESWQELRREGNGEVRGGFNRKVFRSNSSVSWRNPYNNGGPFGSTRKSGVEMNGHGKKRRDEFVLERNRSARYSPNNIDNGLLRFYLTPMRSSWRGGSGKSRPNNSHSIARSILRLY
ncbi:unnamed protein product [Ilex paraguariensis]|uniref:Uncharacterized protein n=1 Tax=Ilex paraguariensis TaxID=185542 RepID=A0ABC8UFG4_9AQUA